MKKIISITLSCTFLLLEAGMFSSCSQHRCPANGGGYVDKPPKAGRHHHASSGLFPKKMRR